MALIYRVAGRSVATAATADNFGAALWNPHATKDITLREIHWFKTVATADNLGLARTTTRGTATLTVTPDIDNHDDLLLAPISGALLDLTYSAQPTIGSPYKMRINLPAAIGAGMIWVFERGLRIPAGNGIGIATPTAVILQPGDITVVWEE
jgi:hypothetical protein